MVVVVLVASHRQLHCSHLISHFVFGVGVTVVYDVILVARLVCGVFVCVIFARLLATIVIK